MGVLVVSAETATSDAAAVDGYCRRPNKGKGDSVPRSTDEFIGPVWRAPSGSIQRWTREPAYIALARNVEEFNR